MSIVREIADLTDVSQLFRHNATIAAYHFPKLRFFAKLQVVIAYVIGPLCHAGYWCNNSQRLKAGASHPS